MKQKNDSYYLGGFSSKMNVATASVLKHGTAAFLEENLDSAREFASFASFFEQNFHKHGNSVNWGKFNELFMLMSAHSCNSSERESHAPAWMRSTKKSNPDKIGICNNLECPLPDRLRVKRSGMVYCAKCNHVNYCNRECQKSDWKRHKEYCFDSSKGEEDKHKKPSYLLFQRSGYNIYLIGDVYSYFRTQK